MRRLFLALALVAVGGVWPAGQAAACGDKFLVVGRGARRVQKARHPASILLLLRSDAQLAAAVRAIKLEATLKQAGHEVETMTESSPLPERLARGRYDFVVTSLEGAPATAREMAAVASPPAVIPVAVNAEGPARLAAEKQYGLVIQAPTRSLSYLNAIDAAMGRRESIAARRN